MRWSAAPVHARILAASLAGAVAFFTALQGSVHAGEAPPAPEEYTAKDCEQNDTAWLSIRACTAFLNRADIDSNARNRFHRSRGMALLKEEEPKEALTDFNRATEIDANDLHAFTGRARANAALGDHNAAVNDWTRAIEQAGSSNAELPETIDKMYLERGTALLAAGNTDAALADYAIALELNPKNTAAHIARANAYFKLNDRDRVLSEFESA
jgi:tetratricopeptide (TPR) repeat protein